MAKKKAAKSAKKKPAAKPASAAAQKPLRSKKAPVDRSAISAPPAAQAKLGASSKRSAKKAILSKTHANAIQGHVGARGRRQQTARDVRKAPRRTP